MNYTFEDMSRSEHLKAYALPGGKHVEAMDPLVNDLFDAVFFSFSSGLNNDCLEFDLEKTARQIIGLARNAVKDGFPVDALDYHVETAMHHLPFKEQKEIRKEFEMATPAQSIRSIPIF